MNRWQKMRIEDVTYGKQKRVLHILSLIGRYTILVLMALFFMFPVVYMVVVSFQNNMAAVAPQHINPQLEELALDGYKDFVDFYYGRRNYDGVRFVYLDVSIEDPENAIFVKPKKRKNR